MAIINEEQKKKQILVTGEQIEEIVRKKAEIEKAIADIAALKKSLENLGDVSGASELTEKVAEIEEVVNKLNTRVNALEEGESESTDLTALQEQVNTIEADLKKVNDLVAAESTKIDSNATDIDDAREKINMLSNGLDEYYEVEGTLEEGVYYLATAPTTPVTDSAYKSRIVECGESERFKFHFSVDAGITGFMCLDENYEVMSEFTSVHGSSGTLMVEIPEGTAYIRVNSKTIPKIELNHRVKWDNIDKRIKPVSQAIKQIETDILTVQRDLTQLKNELPNDEMLINNVVDVVKEQVPLVKTAEQPIFVNSINECTDQGKIYVLPDGYMYAYSEVENYNLLKISEVSFSSRLQDNVEGIVASNAENCVTGWIPVKQGKHYAISLFKGTQRLAYGYAKRSNAKKADGTIIVYNTGATPRTEIGGNVAYNFPDDVSEVMIHLYFSTNAGDYDLSDGAKLKAIQPMIVEGDTAEEAINKAINYEYMDGDDGAKASFINTGLAYNPMDYEERIIALEEKVEELGINPTITSPYFRDVDFGVMPTAYYQGLGTTYDVDGFGKNTTYTEFITKWQSLIANHSGYATEINLGNSSEGQPIYLYNFKPVRITNTDKPIPKVIIVAGQHGTEKSNCYGLYYFVKNLLNNWNQSPVLEYLRTNVELMIIPALNTYGFTNFTYGNANGVNINRNYDADWRLRDENDIEQYGGQAPFDQPESQIVRELVLGNADASLVIDFHTNGGLSVAEYDDITWYGVCTSTDSYYNRMIDAVAHQISAISMHFNSDYELNQTDTLFGFLTRGNGNGILRTWATYNNLVGVLIEGFNGFPNSTAFIGDVFKANEELVANWLMTTLHYLSK